MRGSAAAAAACLLVLSACEASPFREREVDLSPAAPSHAAPGSPPHGPLLRISVAGMESPRGTYAEYSQLLVELAHRMGREPEFIQRRTYAEVNELLAEGRLDVALLCTGGYLELEKRKPGAVEVLAVPVVNGEETYQSLLLVPAGSEARSLADLEGKRFAFSDELSLTGRAWVMHEVARMGRSPERFFGSTVYTGSHDRTVMAVSRGVVDGASVHSVIFQHLTERDPGLLTRVKVIDRSPPFGMTPLVVSRRLDPEVRAGLRARVLGFADDPAGAEILKGVGIDRFIAAPAGFFDTAAEVVGR